jgi:hypothetical protein
MPFGNLSLFVNDPDESENSISAIQPNNYTIPENGSWLEVIQTTCPFLYGKIAIDTEITYESVIEFMKSQNLQYCDRSIERCIEKNCSLLWKWWISKKYANEDMCGSMTKSNAKQAIDTGNCKIINELSELLFVEDGIYRFNTDSLEAHHLRLSQFWTQAGKTFDNVLYVSDPTDEISFPPEVLMVMKVSPNIKRINYESVYAMQWLEHQYPNLLKYFAAIFDHQISDSERSTATEYLLVEYFNGTLESFLARSDKEDPNYIPLVKNMLFHLVCGLDMLEDTGYQHNDVKLQNVGYKLDDEGGIKFVKFFDFQSVQGIDAEGPRFSTDRIIDKTIAAKPIYRDSYALGILMYEIIFPVDVGAELTKSGPERKRMKIKGSTVSGQVDMLKKKMEWFPFNTVASHLITSIPEERWGIKQAKARIQDNSESMECDFSPVSWKLL